MFVSSCCSHLMSPMTPLMMGICTKFSDLWDAKIEIYIYICVGQFYPGLQQCKGKGLAQYLVWGDTNIRGRPANERAKLPSEERCSMLAGSGVCVRGLWSPRHFCPRCLVSLLFTRNSAQDNHITSQRGKYPAKSSGRK